MILVYTPSVWLETNLTTNQKISFLNNLENMYTEAVSYIDSITHSSSYYTDAQAAARYFTAANDGTGSGLIAATLDGYTAEQIISSGSPSGVICWWSGSEASIPSGWYLCNGLNSTPDLRNKFVPGAGSHYNKADTGGSNTVTTTGSITIAGHALTASETAKHTHGTITDYYAANDTGYCGAGAAAPLIVGNTSETRPTGDAGSGNSHTHTASYAGSSSQDKRPAYYALCYIMKS